MPSKNKETRPSQIAAIADGRQAAVAQRPRCPAAYHPPRSVTGAGPPRLLAGATHIVRQRAAYIARQLYVDWQASRIVRLVLVPPQSAQAVVCVR